MSELTDTQVVVLDTLRTVVVTAALRDLEVGVTLKSSVLVCLEGQGLTWSEFVEFCVR